MFVELLLLIVAGCIAYSLLINRIRGLPPGPPPLPFLGNIISITCAKNNDDLFLEWKKKYGGVFTIWIPAPVVMVVDHQMMLDHIVRDGDTFGERAISEKLMNMLLKGKYGIVLVDNDQYKEQRAFAMKALRDLGVGTSVLQDRVIDLVHTAIKQWKEKDGQVIDLTNEIYSAISNVIYQLAYGYTMEFDDPRLLNIKQLFFDISRYFMTPSVFFMDYFPMENSLIDGCLGYPIKKLDEYNQILLEILKKDVNKIADNMNYDETPGCFVEAFLAEKRRRELANGGDPGFFTMEQAVGATYDIWGAGFETTITTFRFGVHYLVEYPEVQRKMHEEIAREIGTRQIRLDDQKHLQYCQAVIQEVQRLANVVETNFMRQTNKDTTIAGHAVPAGTAVIPQFSCVHLDEQNFERPYFFSPERHFKNGQFVKDHRINPFSLGKRSCIGENLARMEIFIALTSLVQHLELSSEGPVPQKIAFNPGFLRSPKPFKVRVTKRID